MLQIVHVTTEQQKEDAMSVRKQVFVAEQQVPVEEEIDQYDPSSDHFVLYDQNHPIGAGRFRMIEETGKVERICVLSSHRGSGAGVLIMQGIEEFAEKKGIGRLKLNAQSHALLFYEKLGYHITSDEFLDAGIPHKSMEKNIKQT
ncbi:GNAT family N-acetyltransferase [Jeotgalibacillus sp. ET6]|uniref:GNAT family N-acetyltransferase n=1 Tax=Jeotgalibacillus sp. ET6 TaxID=3037260 RepID=UPI002418913F|nr:GNAT family N-acetyltransferase [Jeotgalibacillus sp. ET6]MDG5473019.1 GNAT family N-acetyltransferase [Jeotgalibacillus sp. ET6]